MPPKGKGTKRKSSGGNKGNQSNKRNSSQSNRSKNGGKKVKIVAPTVSDILQDELTKLAMENWADSDENEKKKSKFDAKLVEQIYFRDLKGSNLDRIMLLEVGHYLENYLWKNWNEDSSFAHLMSIILLVNEKFRENVKAWECFHSREEDFPAFFEKVLNLPEDYELSYLERTNHILFLINTFQSLEDKMVRDECLKLVSIHLWRKVNPILVEKEIGGNKKLGRFWKKTLESAEENEEEEEQEEPLHHFYLNNLIQEFFQVVESVGEEGSVDTNLVRYCERFAEWMVDLLSQLPTRRFFRLLFESSGFITRCKNSYLAQRNEGVLFNQLLDMLRFYQNFEVDEITGKELTEEEVDSKECQKIKQLQKILFTNFPEKKELAFSSVSTFQEPSKFRNRLKDFNAEELKVLSSQLGLFSEGVNFDEGFMRDRIIETFQKRLSQLHAVNNMAIFPTEGLLWNDNAIPTESYEGETSLALPKLNLQFLTFYDYLLRNYDLYRLESAYQIRMDVEEAVRRLAPRKEVKSATQSGKGEVVVTRFGGWSKMALPLQDFSITNVADPKLGDSKPSKVEAEAIINLNQCKGAIRTEWESIKQHDVVFLLTVRANRFEGEDIDPNQSVRDQIGVKYVRGATIREILDEENNIIRDSETERMKKRSGNVRKLKLTLDAAQYVQDMDEEEDVYGSFNILLRRKSKENNFKAVLETIRDLMNSDSVLPDWLRDIFLGYGDPESGSKERENCTLNFNDTYLSGSHFIQTHPNTKMQFFDSNGKGVSQEDAKKLSPPFKVEYETAEEEKQSMKLRSFVPPIPGPFPHNVPKKNSVPFTEAQVEAIEKGMFEGLTLVVGPPGTGKTDVAVQTISNWYHSFPEQKILIVTHSNQALNQIFEKIMHLDIDERHLLRLGHGQEMLETEKDFSKFGRVNYMLSKRLDLLDKVGRLAQSIGILEDVAHTCETAESFYVAHVAPKVEEFNRKMKEEKNRKVDVLASLFPFTKFFADAPQPLFKGRLLEEDERKSEGCLMYIRNVFEELKECRAFELLRSSHDRSNYLLTKQARIVAMTCTHASLKRSELISLGFKYDNLIMEEAAQILEIEAFIPMLLQEVNKKAGTRLKRVVLIGDHHQLPPVVKNIAFQKYSHFDQSLFTRFVRLGVPTVQLDSQGRARPSLAELYNWRYKNLTNLPNTLGDEFKIANAGLKWDYQFIDVVDYDGKGEYSPSPYFYQNLGEAEYIVALYMYMRMIGYPSKSIAILTTYNGQKNLIKDVFRARTGWTKFFGFPSRITTVDRYQGQQADYVLLSLVRTKAVGHLRDIRRLVVAMSRARFGLFVFGRKSLFENCYELSNTFSQFKSRPDQLVLVEGEEYPTKRKLGEDGTEVVVKDVIHMGNIIASLQQNMGDRFKNYDQYESKSEETRRTEIEYQLQQQNEMEEMEDAAELEMEAKLQHLENQHAMEVDQ